MASSKVAEAFLFLLHDRQNTDPAEVPADYGRDD